MKKAYFIKYMGSSDVIRVESNNWEFMLENLVELVEFKFQILEHNVPILLPYVVE